MLMCARELENYSYLDYERAFENKLITKKERDEIEEFVRNEAEQQRVAEEESIIVDIDRYAEGGEEGREKNQKK